MIQCHVSSYCNYPNLHKSRRSSNKLHDNRDEVVPGMYDSRQVSAALREDPDAFDMIDHRMEFDMLNSVYKTVYNR